MGLDMMLYMNVWGMSDEKFQEDVDKAVMPRFSSLRGIEPRLVFVRYEVLMWRKANAIHNWFVQNVQKGVDDCGEYEVSEEDLRKLLKDVEEVLKDKSKAPEILPTTEGFFFGSTDYDEDYFDDLKYTAKGIKNVLRIKANNDSFVSFEYGSSW
jgi:hypothetical protein